MPKPSDFTASCTDYNFGNDTYLIDIYHVDQPMVVFATISLSYQGSQRCITNVNIHATDPDQQHGIFNPYHLLYLTHDAVQDECLAAIGEDPYTTTRDAS